ncbi:predicted protein [Naegleria gruberi]|uniref:Predicted protein n=1 Tax=Naegleria gruberi TaxID=5762 RepID=D2V5X9_NAEGR|nr:uncharacterized protein NAEGRDRAFT_64239 [Naegleria gruberi]EFC47875.1 predicted protein [Naegleria gruberi]|eukprot:XP_002680619.1 predicted protein [Naegleria gruberi strain NEG-M]
MNIYLKEKPICVNLYVKASTYYNRFIDVNLDIKARIGFSADEHSTSENEWIDIFSCKTAPRLEIVKLFKQLKLDERVLDNTPTWESFGFLNTEFPESIRKDKHFLWFCDSFLSQIPTPFDFIFQYAPNSYLDYLYAVTDEDIGEIYDYSSSSTEEI